MIVLLRGGGDLASGVALRLHRAGIRVVITELPQPMVVRRMAAFAEAVYRGRFSVEGVSAQRVNHVEDIQSVLNGNEIPILIDPQADVLRSAFIREHTSPTVLVDARMTKRSPDLDKESAELVIGLGPGFVAGENCHAAIETNRGHFLGRVLWHGAPQADTGIPEAVARRQAQRVLRAPADGVLLVYASIGDPIESGQVVAEVAGQPIRAAFKGVLRGVLHPGLQVQKGLKVGDLDPRGDPRYCTLVSDKSLAVGGGVLEAILSRPALRPFLWT